MLIESFSGIRGIWGNCLNEEIINKYASSYYKYLVKNNLPLKLIIGRDSRLSGDKISSIFSSIWKNYGIEVIDIGILPTPIVEFAVRYFEASGGVIITASHNEPEYNGMKFLRQSGGVLYPEEIAEVIEFKENAEIVDMKNKSKNTPVDQKIIITAYINFLKTIIGDFNFDNQKILIDPNGGSLSTCYLQIFNSFGINVQVIGENVGEFWRKVEPKKENLSEIPNFFETDTLFSACFDCDADRVEFVLRSGEVVSGQHVLALLLEELLPNIEKKIVITNDATSTMVKEIVEKHGGKMIEVEVGEANVVKKMEEFSLILGGEGSSGGGIVFPNRCRDGILSTLIVCKYLQKTKKTLEENINSLPKYYTNVFKWKNKNVKKMRKDLKNFALMRNLKIVTTGGNDGGMKMYLDEKSWLWIRESKTESGVVRCIIDSNNKENLEKMEKICNTLFEY